MFKPNIIKIIPIMCHLKIFLSSFKVMDMEVFAFSESFLLSLHLRNYELDFDETWWKCWNLGQINCSKLS